MSQPRVLRLLCFAILAACAPAPAALLSTTSPVAPSPASTVTISIAETKIPAIEIDGLRILSPGDTSRISSPLLVEAQASAGATLQIELIGPSGQLYFRQVLAAPQDSLLRLAIPFEINRSSQPARLLLSTQDEFGRLASLDSVDLTLLAPGASSTIVERHDAPHITITAPIASEQFSGGILQISGQARSEPGRPLNIELVTRSGRVLAFGEVYPVYEDGSEYGTFSLELNYEVSQREYVQIAIMESGGIVPGPAHFTAIEVELLP
jgi:hypothetical protein